VHLYCASLFAEVLIRAYYTSMHDQKSRSYGPDFKCCLQTCLCYRTVVRRSCRRWSAPTVNSTRWRMNAAQPSRHGNFAVYWEPATDRTPNWRALQCSKAQKECIEERHSARNEQRRMSAPYEVFVHRRQTRLSQALFIHCESKKQSTIGLILSITSSNVDRFSKFFHWQIHW